MKISLSDHFTYGRLLRFTPAVGGDDGDRLDLQRGGWTVCLQSGGRWPLSAVNIIFLSP